MTNIPSTVHNVGAQNRNRIVTENVTTASLTFANSKDQLYQNSKKIEPIKGYEDVVYIFGDGRMIVSSDGYTNDGEWVLFEPTNRIDGGVK